jgi:peptide/nickel transport system substrate-binding protein
MRRRSFLAGLAGLVATGATAMAPKLAWARARTPYGGRIVMHAPWPLGGMDPHRIDDATAALFGEAVFDTLYARDADGAIVASLAESDPDPDGATLRVTMRTDVRFASGTRFDARAAAASIARSRARDGAPVLVDVPAPRVVEGALVFATKDARRLVRALSSPLVAMVPPRFVPERPDGTGPFRAEMNATGMRLVRNGTAATGPSFLDLVDVRRAVDLATSLREFEGGADDLGWLGSFLHDPRPGAKSYDAGPVGWAILRTGRDAGSADVPGTAQSLADAVPHATLAPLVVGPPWDTGGSAWTGPPVDLLVRDDAPWLVEVARAIAVALSTAGHEVKCVPVPVTEIAARRASRTFALMIDVARRAGPGALGATIGLAAADDVAAASALARHPPRGELPARVVTRTMRVGVVGEIRLQGGRAPDVVLPPSTMGTGIDWGNAFRVRPPSP